MECSLHFGVHHWIQSKEAALQLAEIQRIRKILNLNSARVISGLGPLVGQVQLGPGTLRDRSYIMLNIIVIP